MSTYTANLGGEAKISNLNLHAVVEEHVAQFQIPVQSSDVPSYEFALVTYV